MVKGDGGIMKYVISAVFTHEQEATEYWLFAHSLNRTILSSVFHWINHQVEATTLDLRTAERWLHLIVTDTKAVKVTIHKVNEVNSNA